MVLEVRAYPVPGGHQADPGLRSITSGPMPEFMSRNGDPNAPAHTTT